MPGRIPAVHLIEIGRRGNERDARGRMDERWLYLPWCLDVSKNAAAPPFALEIFRDEPDCSIGLRKRRHSKKQLRAALHRGLMTPPGEHVAQIRAQILTLSVHFNVFWVHLSQMGKDRRKTAAQVDC